MRSPPFITLVDDSGAVASRAQLVLKISDRRNFGRTFTGLALMLGPTLMLLSAITGISVDAEGAAERFEQIAQNEAAYALSGILFLVGALLLLVGSIGLLHFFRGRGVTFGQLAAGLLTLGSVAGIVSYGFGAIEYEMATREGVDRPALATFVDQAEESVILLPIFIMFILGVVIGLILLGIAAWRRGIVPIWAALLIVAAGILTFAASGGVISIISFVALLAGLGWLGVTLLRMSDEDWDAGAAQRERATAAEPPPQVAR